MADPTDQTSRHSAAHGTPVGPAVQRENRCAEAIFTKYVYAYGGLLWLEVRAWPSLADKVQ
jgi:hypothetical protein